MAAALRPPIILLSGVSRPVLFSLTGACGTTFSAFEFVTVVGSLLEGGRADELGGGWSTCAFFAIRELAMRLRWYQVFIFPVGAIAGGRSIPSSSSPGWGVIGGGWGARCLFFVFAIVVAVWDNVHVAFTRPAVGRGAV